MSMTYFFERKDGSVFACEAQEANDAMKRFTHVGTSDGKAYAKSLAAGAAARQKIEAEIKVLEGRLARLTERQEQAEDDGKSTTVLDGRIKATLEELDAKQVELEQLMGPAIEKAFQAELKIAKKNKTPPPDMSVYYPMGGQNVLQPYLAKRPR